MDEPERDPFLAEPFIGALSIVRTDGSPPLPPIWDRWDGPALLLWTDSASPRVRQLAAEPRAAFAVLDHAPLWRAVDLRGTAAVRVAAFADPRNEARAIVARHQEASDIDRPVDADDRGEPKAIPTMGPTSIRARVGFPRPATVASASRATIAPRRCRRLAQRAGEGRHSGRGGGMAAVERDRNRARIGVIGTGWWSTYAHLPALRADPAVDLVAIADPDAAALRRAGEAFAVAARYADHRQLLDAESLDGVVVATPHASHFAIVKDALERGVGVLVEKPMVLRAAEARRLVEFADQNRLPLIVGYPYHFVPQYAHLRELIAAGRLGRLQLVDGLFASMVLEYYRGNPAAYQSAFGWQVTGPGAATYSDPAVAGGGQAQTQVTHAAALLLWLTGLTPTAVAAAMASFDLQVDLCDALALRFAEGAVGTLASTGGIPTPQSAHQQLEYRIYGDAGYALLDAMAGTCAIHAADGTIERLPDVPPAERYPKQAPARHLVDVLLGRAENRSPGALGAQVVALLEAAYRSAADARFVRLDEL